MTHFRQMVNFKLRKQKKLVSTKKNLARVSKTGNPSKKNFGYTKILPSNLAGGCYTNLIKGFRETQKETRKWETRKPGLFDGTIEFPRKIFFS